VTSPDLADFAGYQRTRDGLGDREEKIVTMRFVEEHRQLDIGRRGSGARLGATR